MATTIKAPENAPMTDTNLPGHNTIVEMPPAAPAAPTNFTAAQTQGLGVPLTWTIPGGGSPDMGNVSADGKFLWLSGRYDGVVYAFNTEDGSVKTIPVGGMPHGLTVWPQPGRYSLGHTGNMR